MRELSALEQGPLQELEKSVIEQNRLDAQASKVLDKFISDTRIARHEMEAREHAVASAKKERENLQTKIAEVRRCGLGDVDLDAAGALNILKGL